MYPSAVFLNVNLRLDPPVYIMILGGENMATYKEIQNEARNIGGKTVKTCWIADIKEREGLSVRRSWNRQGRDRKNPCPEDKKLLIKGAMRNLGML